MNRLASIDGTETNLILQSSKSDLDQFFNSILFLPLPLEKAPQISDESNDGHRSFRAFHQLPFLPVPIFLLFLLLEKQTPTC